MSEWQPARIRMLVDDPHVIPGEGDINDGELQIMLRKVIRIRPVADLSNVRLSDFRCYRPGVQIYEIHPDDCIGDPYICEHEILTD